MHLIGRFAGRWGWIIDPGIVLAADKFDLGENAMKVSKVEG